MVAAILETDESPFHQNEVPDADLPRSPSWAARYALG